jgi:hypothetical protein
VIVKIWQGNVLVRIHDHMETVVRWVHYKQDRLMLGRVE